MLIRRSHVIGILGVFLLLSGILMKFAIVPAIVKFMLKRKLSLKNGWPMRDIWSKLPFIIENHVYVFNVTNAVEVGHGAKPIIQEVGPFVYDTFQEKVKQSDNEKDDTVSYVLENTYYYNEKKSNGMSDEMEVYFPHVFILTVATGPFKDNPSQVSFTSRAVDAILNKPESLFYKAKVKTILFEGLAIPCGGIEDYFGKLICKEIHEKYEDFLGKKDGVYYASLFGFRNGTSQKEKIVRIIRGSKNLKNTGKVVEIDGMNNLSIWKDDKCNAFDGTDGTIFPPLMSQKKNKKIALVYPMICRRLSLNYESEVKHSSGMKLLRYSGDLGTNGIHVAEDKCYCATPQSCLKRGMFEVNRCLNVPIIISNPHFYMADPYYLTTVDTLQPNKDKHLTYVDFDPLTGSPIRAHVRAQYNMEIMPMEKFRLMRNYSYAMLPMIWTDEIVALPDFFILKIKIAYFLLKLAEIFEYIVIAFGLALCLLAAFLQYRAGKASKAALKSESASNQMTMSELAAENRTTTTTTAAASSADNNSNNHNNNKKFNIARLLSAIRPAPMPTALG